VECEEDDDFPGSAFYTPRLTARRSEAAEKVAAEKVEEADEGKQPSETSEEASESVSETVSEEEDETVTVCKSEQKVPTPSYLQKVPSSDSVLAQLDPSDVAIGIQSVHECSASVAKTDVAKAHEDTQVEDISLAAPAHTPVEAVGGKQAAGENAEPKSFIQKQRSLSFSRRKKATAHNGADDAPVLAGVNVSAAKALFEAAGATAEPKSFIQKQRSLSFSRRKKATAHNGADDAHAPLPAGVDDGKSRLEGGQGAVPSGHVEDGGHARKLARPPKPPPQTPPPLAEAKARPDDVTPTASAAPTAPAAATACFGEHDGPLTRRVSDSEGTDKSTLMRQRLQRARSSSGKLGAVAAPTLDPWVNEVGVKVYPL
jgi:hypothetical protein